MASSSTTPALPSTSHSSDTNTSETTPDASATRTALNPTTDLVRIAYQIKAFADLTGRSREIPREVAITALYIIKNHVRPTPNTRSGQAAVEFPTSWEANSAQLQRATKAFRDRTHDLRSTPEVVQFFRWYEQPSTGATPEREHSPSASPLTEPRGGSVTSAEEAIYDHSIGPDPPVTMDEAVIQRIIDRAVQAAVAATGGAAPPPNPGTTPPPDQVQRADRPPQFRPRDVGYFDPLPGPAIEVKDNHNIYHNVFSFTNRLRVKATTMDAAMLRQNLDSCLLGAADLWYTNELAHVFRVGLRNDTNGVKEWCDALESRFRDSPSKSLTALEAIRYTVRDVRARRDPSDYVSTLVLHAKNAGIAAIEAAQVLLAYEHMDGILRQNLPRPQDNSTIPALLEELRHQKDIWFDIYGGDSSRPSASSSNRDSSRQEKGKQPQGQYNSNPFRSNFNSQRPYGNYPSNGYGNYSGASRPYFGNSNPYRPFVPYGANFQNNNNNQQHQQPQATQVQSRPLPGGRQQLQITSSRENANTSTGNQNQNRPPNAGNRNPFRPYNSNQQNQQRPYARAYQQAVPDQENQIQNDEQAEYDAYEDAYYQNASWPGPQEENEDPKDAEADADHDVLDQGDTVETHFIATTLPAHFKCRRCSEIFSSNNSLHRHIRSALHIKESSLDHLMTNSVVSTTRMRTDLAVATTNPLTDSAPASAEPEVITSMSTNTPREGYAFRSFHYVTAMIQLFLSGMLFDLCFDTGCTMSLIDRKFLRDNHPAAEIKKMPTPMTVKGIGSKKHEASEYARIKMYLPSKNGSGTVALIEREFHVVDDLTAKALIGIDILKPEGIILDLQNDVMKIGSCRNLEVPIIVTPRGSRTNSTIYSSKRILI